MQNQPQNLIQLSHERVKRGLDQHDPHYQILINRMSKVELLEEMVRFQDERSAKGSTSFFMMVRGKILFRALEAGAETSELRLLAGSYRRHLEHEIVEHLKKSEQVTR